VVLSEGQRLEVKAVLSVSRLVVQVDVIVLAGKYCIHVQNGIKFLMVTKSAGIPCKSSALLASKAVGPISNISVAKFIRASDRSAPAPRDVI
jgi:hypothetical protein